MVIEMKLEDYDYEAAADRAENWIPPEEYFEAVEIWETLRNCDIDATETVTLIGQARELGLTWQTISFAMKTDESLLRTKFDFPKPKKSA